ncbi:MAG: low-specificity L-threonine aldolase [Candidatus Izemoplasmataceae bacterium]
MIDFRSDTVTKPTNAMKEAMMHASVGDDVYEDDLTIKHLEQAAADKLGKEAALFVPSGTMGNQIAIMTHTNRGDEIIIGANSHIKNYEVGAAAVLAGVSYHLVKETKGMMDINAIKEGIRGEDIHFPKTSLICMENAHGSGVVGSLEYMKEVYNLATKNGIYVHLDGARIFNAATHLNVDVNIMAQYADSIMFCLSKGLASPIGSILVGTKAFILKARKYRKMLGGGMRQVGVLGAPGLIALNEMTKRLKTDHDHALYLADALEKIEGFTVNKEALDINMVFVKSTYNLKTLSEEMRKHDVLLGGYKGEYMRLVCHNDITKPMIDTFIQLLNKLIK